MRQVSWSSHRDETVTARRFLCVLAGVVLLLTVALSTGPPAAVASENDENVTVYRSSNASFESAKAITNGTLEPADEVAVGDTLVVAIPSERLADAMNATNGSTTARFFAALDGDAQFRIIQTNPTANANRKIALTGRENVTVHRDGTTTYAVVQTGELTFRYRRVNRTTQIYGGERFAVQFGYDLPDDWSRGTVPSSPIIEFYPPSELPTAQSGTTVTQTKTSSSTTATTATTSTNFGAMTTRGPANTTGKGERETPGIPGFTPLTMLVALLVLAVLSIRGSRS